MNAEPITWQTESGDTVEVFGREQTYPHPTYTYEPQPYIAWYWRLRSPNNQIIAASGESFTRKWSAKRAALRSFPPAPVSESIRPYKETTE